MTDLLFTLIMAIYLLVVGLLFLFGLNFYYLTFLSLRKKAPPRPPDPASWPRVTVQLPVYNEMYVVERLIEAAANLDYPRELLEIQVLDDSTDETMHLARRAVERVRDRGISIVHLHRLERDGFKAGALAAGMEQAQGDFLAVFDADFVPRPDFLKQTLPYFQDAGVAFLQARWGHLNRNYSLLTQLQSLIIDAHFVIEQTARSRSGFWFNFNGTAGVWRKAAISDAGGWKADTLTEDLDLSYRVLLRGWRAVYLRDVEVPAELPVALNAYRRQQYRWARGSLEVAQRQLPRVLRAHVSLQRKVEAVFHLSGYGVHLLLFAIALLYPLVLALARQSVHFPVLFTYALFFNITAFAQTLFFISAQQQLGRPWWKMLPVLFFVSALGAGMMLNTVKAAYGIAWKKRVLFERTPKFGIERKEQNWNGKRYQLGLDRLVLFEVGFALFNGWTTLLAIGQGNWVIAFYTLMFCAGLLFTSGMSIQQALSLQAKRRRAPFASAGGDSDRATSSSSSRTGLESLMPGESAALMATASPLEPPNGVISRPGCLDRQAEGRLTAHRAAHLSPAGFALGDAQEPDLLRQAILKTIAYADVFEYPLSSPQVLRYLTGAQASPEAVQAALEELRRSRQLSFQDGTYMLPGREAIARTRRRRQAVADRLWPKAIAYGRWIARLPFVRMVAVTGALAMDNVEDNADIDYLIVTRPDRLWLCRGLVILLVHWARREGVTLCPNYLLSEQAMVFSDRSLYTAHELAQMVPLHGMEVYTILRRLNAWSEAYLPNAAGMPGLSLSKTIRKPEKLLQSLAEKALLTPPGTWIERWEMERKIRKFRQAGLDSPEIAFCADWCKGHFERHGQKTMASYALRIQMRRIQEGSK